MKQEDLNSLKKQFEFYKQLGDKTFAQIADEKLFWKYNDESNSIAIIVKHLWGNMLSRFTDFLTTDGEKEWRDREREFENNITTKEELLAKWNEGWQCLFNAINPLTTDDLEKIVYIRNMGHSVVEAINRQLTHYAYHVGQIVYIGKMVTNEKWTSLSIPKGQSKAFNTDKFSKEKHREHFTDAFMKRKDQSSS
jgi:hypothetical protein